MAAIEAIRIGPFTGGLNTASDPTSIGDADLAVMDNLELDPDGSLVNRPPVVNLNTPINDDGVGSKLRLLGYFTEAAGTNYLIAHNGFKTYYYTGSAWTEIAAFPASAVAQYKDKLWLVAPIGSASDGGSWSPTSPFSAVATMPKGEAIVAHKERLWVAPGPTATTDGTKLSYSDVGDPANWTTGSAGFLNINAGDGQNIVALHIYYNDILVFKTRSTWRYAYTSDPATGTVSQVSSTVGASARDAVVPHENVIYVVYSDKVYEMSNYNFRPINNKVPLKADSPVLGMAVPVSASVWNDRLLVNYFGSCFVFGLKTETWCRWKFMDPDFVFGGIQPIPITYQDQRPMGYIYNAANNDRDIYRVSPDITTDTETMECVLETKNYDYQSAHSFKRMTWWGIDVVLRSNFRAYASPIVYHVPVTWGELAAYTWASRAEYTWARPLDKLISVEDIVDSSGASGERKFIKLLKSLRFRQIFFRLEFDTDGSNTSAPLKLFSMTTMVAVKQRVPAKIS